MKKIFFLALVCSITFAFGQSGVDLPSSNLKLSDSQISDIVRMSKEINAQKNGVQNPDLIFPGQKLTFVFQDKTEHTIIVQKGEYQRKILATKLAELIRDHGQVVDPNTIKQVRTDDSNLKIKNPLVYDLWGKYGYYIFMILLFLSACLFGICLVVFVLYLIKKYKRANKILSSDDLRRDSPVMPGGVRPENAMSHMNMQVQQQYGYNINWLGPLVRGTFSSTKRIPMQFANGTRMERAKNITAYRRLASINGGEPESIIFFEPCGNLTRIGKFLREGIDYTFTADTDQTGVLQQVTAVNV